MVAAICLGGALAPLSMADAQGTRDFVTIVGPRSVYPFVSAVIDRFGTVSRFKFPSSETTDTDAGLKLICAGDGIELPDVALATRPLQNQEKARCLRTGAGDLIELKLGFDAVVLASAAAGPVFRLTPRDVFLAVAAKVPDPTAPAAAGDNPLAVPPVDNLYRTWDQIDPKLPATPIRVLGPPRTAIARDVFASTILKAGCRAVPSIAALEEGDPAGFRRACETVRTDGAFVEVSSEPQDLVERLTADPGTLAMLTLTMVTEPASGLRAAALDGIVPSIDTINDGTYTAARPIFLFVKRANVNVVPGLREFVAEFVGLGAAGHDGYLRKSVWSP
ncbi:MAG: phosphate ABC transporter substrate-binding protein [Candidatus Competibacteraceae bacterium]|nr:phosphate ABC transporter substrate-binding protein [Candidatus Competibacteraceae bacterium]